MDILAERPNLLLLICWRTQKKTAKNHLNLPIYRALVKIIPKIQRNIYFRKTIRTLQKNIQTGQLNALYINGFIYRKTSRIRRPDGCIVAKHQSFIAGQLCNTCDNQQPAIIYETQDDTGSTIETIGWSYYEIIDGKSRLHRLDGPAYYHQHKSRINGNARVWYGARERWTRGQGPEEKYYIRGRLYRHKDDYDYMVERLNKAKTPEELK